MIPAACSECGAEIGPDLLSCPGCRRLIHSEELRRLSDEAARAGEAGELSAALGAWRSALELLPGDSRQHGIVFEKVQALSRRVDAARLAPPRPASKSGMGKALAGLGALGLLLWKFKFILAFIATKGKILLLGLSKGGTFLSMMASFGVYWTIWGWKFALGFILSMYIHEMGHIAMLQHFGIKATAPMFIPGLGAFVRLKQYPANPREDSRIGLAGPMWGLGACAAAFGIFLATGVELWAVIARFGAWVNLFNLIPWGSLDGGRGFRSLARRQRWIVVAAVGVAFALSHETLLLIVLGMAVVRIFADRSPEESDWVGLSEFIFLIAALSALCMIPLRVS